MGLAAPASRAGEPWEERVAEALRAASAARELPTRGRFTVKQVDRAELATALGERGDPERGDPRPLRPMAEDDDDARECLLGIRPVDRCVPRLARAPAPSESPLASLAAGVYVPRERALYVLAEGGRTADGTVLLHELVHALQDDHFGLAPMITEDARGADALSARHAFAEGDATFAVLRDANLLEPVDATFLEAFLAGFLRANRRSAGEDVPVAVADATAFPYVYGTHFVWSLYVRGGWRAVNAAWRRPPRTTEQLLHVEKYMRGEPPRPLPQAPRVPAGFTRRARRTFGELDLRTWLAVFLPESDAATLASGWGNGEAELFARGDDRALRVRVRWDAPLRTRAHDVAARLAHAFGGPRFARDGVGALEVSAIGDELRVVAGPAAALSDGSLTP